MQVFETVQIIEEVVDQLREAFICHKFVAIFNDHLFGIFRRYFTNQACLPVLEYANCTPARPYEKNNLGHKCLRSGFWSTGSRFKSHT